MRYRRKNAFSALLLASMMMASISFGQSEITNISGEDKSRILQTMEEIFKRIPYESEDITAAKIAELKALANPKDATTCIELLPEFARSGLLATSSDSIERRRHFSFYLHIFDKIYESVDPELYYRTALMFYPNENEHFFVYYLINKYTKCADKEKKDSVLEKVLTIMPLKKGDNALILTAVYNSYGDEVYSFIDKVIERNQDKSWLIEELQKDKKKIMRNTKKNR